ncbi:MAG: DUF1588 domain-containing protein [Verrucomicrobia bacterium]|nr:DUF1588 domain-containing protein [Verrucomicrobiota bacterium]
MPHYRSICCVVLFTVLLSPSARAGEATFKKLAKPFLENYCLDCHDVETQKGKVSLENLSDVTAANASMWKRVWEQVALKEMPPRKKKNQPKPMQRLEISKWITDGLATALKDKGGYSDHLRPIKGNHIDHDLLFGANHKNLEPASTLARIWRIHPQEHLVRLNDLITPKRKYDPMRPGLWTHGDHIPLNLEGQTRVYFGLDRYIGSAQEYLAYVNGVGSFQSMLSMLTDHGLRNYPFLYSVNSSEAMQISGVAEKILRFMAYGPNAEPYQFVDPPFNMNEIPGQYRNLHVIFYGKEIKRPLTPMYELMKTPGVSDKRLSTVINFIFEALTLRPPSAEETAIYLEIVNKSIKELGKEDGVFLGLTPIFLDRDALFRPELCETGKPDKYGRVMLGGDELALAINAAFSYVFPETDHLRTALAEGQLKTRQDVKREVTRILNDDSIRKPRVLQFFREYFDYDRAGSICKDEKALTKSGGHFGTYYSAMNSMIANTDRLIELILHEDENVLKELLTTDRVVYQPYTSGQNFRHGILFQTDIAYFLVRGKKYIPFKKYEEIKPTKNNKLVIERAKRLVHDQNKLHHIFPNPVKPIYVRQSQFDRGRAPPAKNALKAITTVDPNERLGILTHPVWLASHSDAMDNHAILRGRWIRERLLGDAVPDIPITVDAMLPDEPKSTLRHRMRVTREKECWRCHQKMDPLGLPFEMYNQLGILRDKEQGKPVDTSGEIILSGDPALDGPVTNAIDMIKKLAASKRVEEVFVRHVFRFWMGRNETINDAPVLQDAYSAYKNNGGSMKALLTSLLTSDAFLYRTVARSR